MNRIKTTVVPTAAPPSQFAPLNSRKGPCTSRFIIVQNILWTQSRPNTGTLWAVCLPYEYVGP